MHILCIRNSNKSQTGFAFLLIIIRNNSKNISYKRLNLTLKYFVSTDNTWSLKTLNKVIPNKMVILKPSWNLGNCNCTSLSLFYSMIYLQTLFKLKNKFYLTGLIKKISLLNSSVKLFNVKAILGSV